MVYSNDHHHLDSYPQSFLIISFSPRPMIRKIMLETQHRSCLSVFMSVFLSLALLLVSHSTSPYPKDDFPTSHTDPLDLAIPRQFPYLDSHEPPFWQRCSTSDCIWVVKYEARASRRLDGGSLRFVGNDSSEPTADLLPTSVMRGSELNASMADDLHRRYRLASSRQGRNRVE